jgi:hypothetical protein
MPTKSDTKNVSVVDEQKKSQTVRPTDVSDKAHSVITSTFQKFRTTQSHRDGAWENFDGLNLIDYINESVRRFITNVDLRSDIEDWQSRVHDPFTRNKTLAVLSKVVQVLPIAEFVGRGDEDFRKGQILTDLYQYSEDLDDYEELMINILLEAIIKGTAIAYEGHERKVNAIRNVTGAGDDLKVTDGVRRVNRLYGTLVPLEDFYPSNVGERNIKMMPYCFWRTVLPYQSFLQNFASYSRASKVQPKVTLGGDVEQRPYYLDYISSDVQDGNVEVLRYYNRDVDEYVMVANGVWLNPIMQGEAEVISPLPFEHKELPFWDIRFELYVNFFYGKSLPDKLKSLQDVLNVLTNMLLDQSFLTIFPPILTAGFDSIEDDYLRPGRRTPVDTQGLSIKDQYMKLDLGVPQGWHEFILQYTRKVMEESSMDQVQSGVAGVGGRTTKAEIDTASAGVTAILGLFGRLIKYGLRRKALLRSKNILQFWTDSNSPVIEQVLGEGGAAEVKDVFNTFKVENTPLTSGKRGLKIIEMYADKSKKPTKKQLQTRKALTETTTNKHVEIVAIDADYIRDFEFDVKLNINTKSEDSKEMQKMLQLEKVRVYMSFWPDLVDKTELLAQTAEKMGDDPMKIISKEAIDTELQALTQDQAKMQEQAANQLKDNGKSTLPGNTLPNQALQKAMGKQLEFANQDMLQSQMIG